MKRFITILFIMVCPQLIFGQIHPIGGQINNSTGNLNGNYNKTVPMHIALSETDTYGRQVLNELARTFNKPPRSAALVIDFNVIIKSKANNFSKEVKIESTTFQYSGDVNYKGFNLNEVLSPVYYTANVKAVFQGGAMKDFPISGNINNSLMNSSSFTFIDSLNNARDINIHNFQITYNASCVNKIRECVELINNYFLSVALVDNTFGLLQSINLNDIENFRLHQKKLDDADLKLNELENRNYNNILQLAQYDPEQLNKKINDCRNISNNIRQQFNQMMANLYALFYNRGVDFLRAGNIPKAEQYFHFSLELNPSFTPSLLQLGIIDFRRDNLMEAICKSDDILYNLYPDPETKQRTYDLIRDVYEKRIEYGNSFLKVNKNYYKSVDQFEEARRICEKYTAVRCDDELFNGIRIAKTGIYQDHINYGRIAIQQNNLADADRELDNAIRYQSLNARDITNNSEALVLKKVVRQRYYERKITEAKNNTLVKNYVTGLLNFDEAEQMLKDYELTAPSDLKTSQQQAARPRISELFYDGDRYIEQGDLVNASKKMKQAIQLQVKYDLTNEVELNKLKEQLREKISTQECINAQKEITALFNSGMQKKSSKQLLEASNDFNIALDISRQFNNCAIDVTQLESNELEIRPAATYLGMMRDFKDKEYKRQFSDCISIYNKATNYFTTRNVASFGINHEPDYYNYVSSKGSIGLMQYVAETYTSQNELEKALTLFKLLLSKNVDDKILEGSLYELGFKFGKREAQTNPGSKAKKLVKQYTSDDKNLKRFEKGFIRGYNE